MADDTQPIDPTQIGGTAAPPPDLGSQQAAATPVLGKQGYQGPRPILMDLIQGLISPKMQAPGPGQMARPVSRAATFEDFLGNFIGALGQGFAASGHGPGAAARGAGAAIGAPLQMQQQRAQFGQQQQLGQAQIEAEQAATAQRQKQTELAGSMVTVDTPSGRITIPYAAAVQGGFLKGMGAAQEHVAAQRDIAQENIDAKQKAADQNRSDNAIKLKQQWDMQTRDLQTKLGIARIKEAGASTRAANSAAQKQQGLTTATRSMIEIAPTVKNRIANMRQLIDDPEVRAGLGPGAGRWSEMMAGKIGATDPKYTALRSENALLDTALMRMHVGSRGGQQMLEHFRDIVNSGKQSPENMKAALDVIDKYADEKIQEGRAGTTLPQAPAPSGKKGNKVLDPLGIR